MWSPRWCPRQAGPAREHLPSPPHRPPRPDARHPRPARRPTTAGEGNEQHQGHRTQRPLRPFPWLLPPAVEGVRGPDARRVRRTLRCLVRDAHVRACSAAASPAVAVDGFFPGRRALFLELDFTTAGEGVNHCRDGKATSTRAAPPIARWRSRRRSPHISVSRKRPVHPVGSREKGTPAPAVEASEDIDLGGRLPPPRERVRGISHTGRRAADADMVPARPRPHEGVSRVICFTTSAESGRHACLPTLNTWSVGAIHHHPHRWWSPFPWSSGAGSPRSGRYLPDARLLDRVPGTETVRSPLQGGRPAWAPLRVTHPIGHCGQATTPPPARSGWHPDSP